MNPAAEREALVAALRRRDGCATAGDLAADTGFALDAVELRLRDLVHDYESHLDVDEAGRLRYCFAPDLRERLRPESPEERRARRRLRLSRLLRRGVQGLTLAGVATYGWVYGALALAVFVTFGMLGGKVWITELVIAHRNRFRQARGKPLLRTPTARPWDEGERATPVAKPIWPRLKAMHERIVRFVAGPARRGRDLESREAAVVAWLRGHGGVVVSAEVVRLLGGSLDDADRLLTRLLVRHCGDVEVDDDGTLRYRFDALATTAGAPAVAGGTTGDTAAPTMDEAAPDEATRPVWAEPSPIDDRLVRDRGDLWVPAFGAVNVAAALTLELWLLPRLGWESVWLDALLVWFPLGWTALLAAAAVLRQLAGRRRRAEREREWARASLLRVIFGRGGALSPAVLPPGALPSAAEAGGLLPVGDPRALRRLVPEPAPPAELLAAVADEITGELEGDVDAAGEAERQLAGADVVARFPRLQAELASAARARAALAEGHGRIGAIVWSTRDADEPPSPR